jgi:hypothetical protein
MDDLQKIEILQKRVTAHLADMKRLERENLKNKKRGDMLQKEKDHARTELSKSMTLKEKLEKLCRELQRENNRLKVRLGEEVLLSFRGSANGSGHRTRTRPYKTLRKQATLLGTRSLDRCCGSFRTIRRRKITPKLKLSI